LDFFDSLKQYLIFVLLCSTKILALLAARLAVQGFAGYLDPIRGGLLHRWPIPVSGCFAPENRGPASKAARFFCHRQRFAAFPSSSPSHFDSG